MIILLNFNKSASVKLVANRTQARPDYVLIIIFLDFIFVTDFRDCAVRSDVSAFGHWERSLFYLADRRRYDIVFIFEEGLFLLGNLAGLNLRP